MGFDVEMEGTRRARHWRVHSAHAVRIPEPVQLGTHTEQYKKALMRNNIGGEELLCMNEELLVKCGAAQPPGLQRVVLWRAAVCSASLWSTHMRLVLADALT